MPYKYSLMRPAYRKDIAHICSICREEFDDRDEFADHWNDHHW